MPSQNTINVQPATRPVLPIDQEIARLKEERNAIILAHNYTRGAPASVVVQDPAAGGAGGPTIAFAHNTVLGNVGLNGHLQFYANNLVYGLINNVGGVPGWLQAGVGTGMDASGNTEHEVVAPALPAAWVD